MPTGRPRWRGSRRARHGKIFHLRSRHRAATENEDLKVKILKDLCTKLQPRALLATNTSSISITKLAAATDRPDRFIGLHFFNPVPLMALLELIRGLQTSDDTHAKAEAF